MCIIRFSGIFIYHQILTWFKEFYRRNIASVDCKVPNTSSWIKQRGMMFRCKLWFNIRRIFVCSLEIKENNCWAWWSFLWMKWNYLVMKVRIRYNNKKRWQVESRAVKPASLAPWPLILVSHQKGMEFQPGSNNDVCNFTVCIRIEWISV